jgi:hypothetical protein
MATFQDKLRLTTIFLFCLLNLGFGLHGGQMPMLLGGALGLVYVVTVATTGRGRPAKTVRTPAS